MSFVLGWLADHWLLVAAFAVALAAWANPLLVWKLKAWILLAVVAWWGWTGHAAYDALKAATDTEQAATLADLARARADATELARLREHELATRADAIGRAYERGKEDAQRTADRVAADLRAGNLQLRAEIRALAARGVPGDPAAAGEPSDAAERGEALVGAAVGVGAQCDALQRALIDAYDAARGTP